MADVWAVIGDEHTHKTSSIRALTGVQGIKEKWKVAYIAHGNALTYVDPRGLQENRPVLPQEFIQAVKAANVNYVIVALRYKNVSERLDATGYLTAFLGAGWNIAGYAVLGPDALLPPVFGAGVAIPECARHGKQRDCGTASPSMGRPVNVATAKTQTQHLVGVEQRAERDDVVSKSRNSRFWKIHAIILHLYSPTTYCP